MLAGAALLPGDNSASAAGPGVIDRVGLGRSGVAISADGRFVAFTQGIYFRDIFLHDRKTQSTQAIGIAGHKFPGLDISADGRYLAFVSSEAFVPEDTLICNDRSCPDVYVYDRELDTYELVSVASDGSAGNGNSGWYDDLAISADGRFVVFASLATNLAANGGGDGGLFVRDRLFSTTEHISDIRPVGANISADGRFVTFDSGDGGGSVFVLDRDTDKDGVFDEADATETTTVSGTNAAHWPAISGDGRFIAFHTWDQAIPNVVLHDRQSGATTIVAETGMLGQTAMDLSSDGRFLAFASDFSLVPEDVNTGCCDTDVYLYDRESGAMELLSVAKDGSPADGASGSGYLWEQLSVIALTPDARYAAFHSGATNFVPGESAGGVFVAGTSLLGIVDTDGDGCSDKQELGPHASMGGRRDPESFWDFFDVPIGEPAERDGRVNILDIGAVVLRFGSARETPPTKEEALAEALSPPPPAPAYHAASDRGGPIPGQEPWNLLPPDGSINMIDIGAAVVQFGHSCA